MLSTEKTTIESGFLTRKSILPSTDHVSTFTMLDWVALGIYFLISIIGGVLSTRKQNNTNEYFRAAGTIPAWAAAISLLATSQSAATFIGAPQSSFLGDLSYFSANLAYILGVCIVGFVFVPAIYKSGAETVYGFLQKRFVGASGLSCSLAFLIGRIFASGARIFIGAMAISYVYYGENNVSGIQGTVIILTIAALIYTYLGGVRAVIWTDILQAFIYITVLLVAVYVLWYRIDMSPAKVYEILSTAGKSGTSKLNLVQASVGNYWSLSFSFFAVLIGHTMIAMGAYGTDHDLVQRYMTCKDAKTGTKSAIMGILMGVPIQFLFLVLGLLLFILYKKTELVLNGSSIVPLKSDQMVIVHFIMYEMPSGLKGMMLAGLFAMTLASTASAFNAMSSSFINDVVIWKFKKLSELKLLQLGKYSMVLFAFLLGLFAYLAAFKMVGDKVPPLVEYAMSVMTYAYSGLLAVFCVGIFTNRGNYISVFIALISGFFLIFLMTNFSLEITVKDYANYYFYNLIIPLWKFVLLLINYLPGSWEYKKCLLEQFQSMGFPWKMAFATSISFLICMIPKGKGKPLEEQKEEQKVVA